MTLEELGIINDMPRGWVSGKSAPKWHYKVYRMWADMWRRVKNDSNESYKTWNNCLVFDDFKYLSNFVKWIESQFNFQEFCNTCNKVKWSLDKDIKNPNNRNYFPECMMLITSDKNTLERLDRLGNPKPKQPIKGISILDGSIITFDSLKEASQNGFHAGAISRCINGKLNSHKNYKWSRLVQDK